MPGAGQPPRTPWGSPSHQLRAGGVTSRRRDSAPRSAPGGAVRVAKGTKFLRGCNGQHGGHSLSGSEELCRCCSDPAMSISLSEQLMGDGRRQGKCFSQRLPSIKTGIPRKISRTLPRFAAAWQPESAFRNN